MAYVVVRTFKDLQDADHIYRVGDQYPRSGKTKKARLDELAGSENKIGVPVIKKVKEADE
jgi:hypothetical protein